MGGTRRLTITDIGTNKFIFNFNGQATMIRIYDDGLWYAMGSIASLQTWMPEKQCTK